MCFLKDRNYRDIVWGPLTLLKLTEKTMLSYIIGNNNLSTKKSNTKQK